MKTVAIVAFSIALVMTTVSGGARAERTEAPATATSHVTGQEGWIRDAPPGAAVRAGYLTLSNDGDTDVALVGATSDAFGAIEMHEMHMTDGVMRMRPVARVVVPAQGSVTLAPGGMHLMMFRPARALAIGDGCEIVLRFESGETIVVPFTVKRADG
jgi:periplasmic copper chaperone A